MKHILYLEDEESIGRIYSTMLQKAGYGVRWKRMISEIEKESSSLPTDVIILDQRMSHEEREGTSLSVLLKKRFPKAKIILLTNYSPFQVEQEIQKHSLDGYFLKINTPPKVLISHLAALVR